MSRRLCFALDLVNDNALIAEYEKRHLPGAVWPAVIRDIRAQGYEVMEIWRVANRLFMIAEVSDEFPRSRDPGDALIAARWEAEMDRYQRPIVAGGAKWLPMRRIFALSEAGRGQG